MSSFNVFLFQKMLPFGGFFFVHVSALFFSLFGFFSKAFSRTQRDKLSQFNNSTPIKPGDDQEEKTEEAKPDAIELKDKENVVVEEKESPNFFFKFQFQTQTFEELSRKFKGDENYNVGMELESIPSTSTNKYEFKSGNDFSCIMEKPDDLSFCVKELYADSNNGFLSEEYFLEQNLKDEAVTEEITETEEKVAEKTLVEAEQSEETVCEEEEVDLENNFTSHQDVSRNFQFLSEKGFTVPGTDMDSITSSPEYMSNLIGSGSDGFLSDGDFEENFEVDSLSNIDRDKGKLTKEEADDFDNEDRDIMEVLRKSEESQNQNEDSNQEESGNDNGSTNTLDNSEKSNLDNSFASDSEDSNGLETLWEHQDLIEQLKMELKKVRATGLPTILEESESPKIMDDLKPWKIDEKFQHVDRMSELHKFYKSYRERMRKFDILNYQKMYAIGFLQSKDPFQSISSHTSSSSPAITSLISQNLRIGRRKKSDFDPMTKFIKELHSDLEMVYVGQLCLSWEILHWQYEKAIEIWEYDPYGMRRYNEVAGEFQQFQVLMQRFIENEPFECPRVQNYVKNRCVLRNILQVPVIRDPFELVGSMATITQ
ncbi:hypothetical protein REPUB_Repub09cG0042700 [Reevesia pubescens]